MTRMFQALLVLALVSLSRGVGVSDDWTRFRGPDGSGISPAGKPPTEWSETKNVKWKTPLPGPGSSSPIVLGNRVFVTCYSGYGEEGGRIEDLKRHLVCVNRQDGAILWSNAVSATLPEDPFNGFITEHGYASSSPVTDGEHVFVFFGKTGVLAFDLEGNQVWQVNVGQESSSRRWGSGASPILYKDTVIVNASEESQSIRALDKATGKEVWQASAQSLELVYTTPAIVPLDDDRQELVIPVPGEVWGLNPDTGKLKWYLETDLNGNISPMPLFHDGVVYVYGGLRGAGSVALRPGGDGNVTASHLVWNSRESSYVATPILHEGHLYWIDDRGMAHCADAATGAAVYSERLRTTGGGRPFYASLVLADGKLYGVSRWNGTFVYAAKPKYEQLALNRIAGDDSDFSGTPAISDNELFLRSNRFLYCVAE